MVLEVSWEHLKALHALLLHGGYLITQPEGLQVAIISNPIHRLDCLTFVLVKIGLCWFEVHLAFSLTF